MNNKNKINSKVVASNQDIYNTMSCKGCNYFDTEGYAYPCRDCINCDKYTGNKKGE